MYGGVYIGPNGNDVQTPPAVTSRFQDLQLCEADRYGFVGVVCVWHISGSSFGSAKCNCLLYHFSYLYAHLLNLIQIICMMNT